ncbi:helix-turn-helix domain-containing protein [Mycobacterium sp. C31M]
MDRPGRYPVTGSEYWGLSFIRRQDGTPAAELDGPSLRGRTVDGHLGERYWGVELAAYVAVPGVPKRALLGETVNLPISKEHVTLGEHRWPIPDYTELEDWVNHLAEHGGLLVDEEVRKALDGDRIGASARTWQRRYRRTVGLTAGQVEQLHRAQLGYLLLQSGHTPAEAAAGAGFADQPHLTRALRLIRGQTPAAIIAAQRRRQD